jgi:hypothetical protein
MSRTRLGFTAWVPIVPSRSVRPSGAERATAAAPTPPPAPERFSTTTGWPSRCERKLPGSRPSVSVVVPGAKGTTSRSGRSGQGAGCAAAATGSRAMPLSQRRRDRTFMESPP